MCLYVQLKSESVDSLSMCQPGTLTITKGCAQVYKLDGQLRFKQGSTSMSK